MTSADSLRSRVRWKLSCTVLKTSGSREGLAEFNHCVALHKRYYRMWGKHLNCAKLQAHIAKRRKGKPFWQLVGSQAVQDICQRIEKGYQLFFKHNSRGVRPPGFKKVKRYKSFTLKQAGYKFLGGNRVKIGSRVYQYWNSREIALASNAPAKLPGGNLQGSLGRGGCLRDATAASGTVKTLTIKRTPLGELFMLVVIDATTEPEVKFETGKIALIRLWFKNVPYLQ